MSIFVFPLHAGYIICMTYVCNFFQTFLILYLYFVIANKSHSNNNNNNNFYLDYDWSVSFSLMNFYNKQIVLIRFPLTFKSWLNGRRKMSENAFYLAGILPHHSFEITLTNLMSKSTKMLFKDVLYFLHSPKKLAKYEYIEK